VLSVTPGVMAIQRKGKVKNAEGERFTHNANSSLRPNIMPMEAFERSLLEYKNRGRNISDGASPMLWQKLENGKRVLYSAGVFLDGLKNIGFIEQLRYELDATLIDSDGTKQTSTLRVVVDPKRFRSVQSRITSEEDLNELVSGEKRIVGVKVAKLIGAEETESWIYPQNESNLLFQLILKTPSRWVSRHIDRAQLTHTGGIDLSKVNDGLLNQNSGVRVKLHIDAAQLAQLQNASGFTVGNVKIQSLKNLPAWLGIADS